MANTYTLISSNVLSSSAASVTFSAIPATYTDLVVKTSVRETNNSGVMLCKINGTTTGYTGKELTGSGLAAASDSNYTGTNGFGLLFKS